MGLLLENTQKTLMYLQGIYIQKGYDRSGSMTMEELQKELGVEKEELKKVLSNLLEQKLIQRQSTDSDRFELTYGVRKRLIEEQDLSAVWEKVAPEFFPNDRDFGEVPVTLFLAYING